jgi:hypothetical protein
MNILIESSNRNYLGYHELCKVILKEYKEAQFGCFTRTQKIKFFFDVSTDPSFKVYDTNCNDELSNFNTKSDLKIIRQFESFTGASIWKLLSSDRVIGWTDKYGNYGTYIQKKIRLNRSFLLHKVASDIKFYSNVFNDFKPDIFIPAMAMGSISVVILEALCISSGVKYLLPEYSRVSNLHRISENIMCLSPEIDKEYFALLNNNNIEECQDGFKLYQKTTEINNKLNNFDADYLDTYGLYELNTIFDQVKLFYKFILLVLIDIFIHIKKIIKSILFLNNQVKLNIHKLFLSIKIQVQRYLNQKTVLSKNFGSLPGNDQKYLYFPLYNIPEYSSNFQSVMWTDIASVVELLAKSIPGDWIIVLKEHPTGLKFNCREVDFYSKISSLPNVIFAPLKSNSKKLIINSEIVFVTVGTSGWEAILYDKPVISPVENFWDCMSLSSKCSDVETMGDIIKLEVNRNQNIPNSEREKKIIFFLEALLRNSFPISNPEVFSYYYEGSKEQYTKQGQELASGFIDFMKKIKIHEKVDSKDYFQLNSYK